MEILAYERKTSTLRKQQPEDRKDCTQKQSDDNKIEGICVQWLPLFFLWDFLLKIKKKGANKQRNLEQYYIFHRAFTLF